MVLISSLELEHKPTTTHSSNATPEILKTMHDITSPPPSLPNQSQQQQEQEPILILGAGIFGLSTALSLLHYHRQKNQTSPISPLSQTLQHAPIRILEASPTLPNPVGSSVDSSRIVRADYPSPLYAQLARQAQERWRDQGPEGWGAGGRYTESGLVVVADHEDRADGDGDGESGRWYMQGALENVRAAEGRGDGQVGEEGRGVQELPDRASIRQITGYASAMGDSGYVNWGSGWADAEACVAFALEKIRREDTEGRVSIECGKRVERLLFSDPEPDPDPTSINHTSESRADLPTTPKPICTGIQLSSGTILKASLVILATGSWSPTLLDLRGRATATGQVLAYLRLTESEHDTLSRKPVLLNMSRGMYVMPPPPPPSSLDGDGDVGPAMRELKIARHGFGYRNMRRVPRPALGGQRRRERGVGREEGRRGGDEQGALQGSENVGIGTGTDSDEMFEVSVPDTTIPIPPEGERACREMAREAFAYPDPDSNVKMEEERNELAALAERPFSRTRLCWYCDTYALPPQSNSIIIPFPPLPFLTL